MKKIKIKGGSKKVCNVKKYFYIAILPGTSEEEEENKYKLIYSCAISMGIDYLLVMDKLDNVNDNQIPLSHYVCCSSWKFESVLAEYYEMGFVLLEIIHIGKSVNYVIGMNIDNNELGDNNNLTLQ